MINFTNKNNAVVADNRIVIGGVEFLLTDEEATKLYDIANGMISTRNTTPSVSLAPSKSTTQTEKAQSTQKPSKDFPDLGTPTATIGFVTAYSKLVRYWETGFCPNKVKYGIKMSLQEAGAKWNKAQGAFEFATVKACNDWLKVQKARQSK